MSPYTNVGSPMTVESRQYEGSNCVICVRQLENCVIRVTVWLLLRWIDGATTAARERVRFISRPGSPMKEGRKIRSEYLPFRTRVLNRPRQDDRQRVIDVVHSINSLTSFYDLRNEVGGYTYSRMRIYKGTLHKLWNAGLRPVSECSLTSHCKATRELLETDLMVLNHGQVMRTTPDTPFANYHSTPTFKPRQT
ncbi:hypothetical protein TNCV_2626441 [Trichonephila clavipes]|uniref:Uncharacterized protein n=1 Tax=Trichonephila clavipes TaxID=2585209 RepID=A0A8X6W731_TRICX|nr:hypothetical protein TNCV_2626441 [Trichonephila clavipes]